MAVAAKRVSGSAAETLFSADFGPVKTELVRAPSLAILLLLVATSLGVYKPWGLTRYGKRKQQERRKVVLEPNNETPLVSSQDLLRRDMCACVGRGRAAPHWAWSWWPRSLIRTGRSAASTRRHP